MKNSHFFGWFVGALTLVLLLGMTLHSCGDPEFLVASEEIPTRLENPDETRCEGLGGSVLHFGHDNNDSGILEPEEYKQSVLNCRARVDGAEVRTRQVVEPPGEHCIAGGIRVEVGLDNDNSGFLEDDEVNDTFYVCDGRSRITELETIPPGMGGCPQGGTLIRSGDDTTGDGVPNLNVVEKTVCTGERSVLRVMPLPAGSACLQGGVAVSSGFDRNNNRRLDDGEVELTEAVCNGIDGLTALSEQELIAPSTVPGAACNPFGGTRIKTGLDLNRDGDLQESEIQTRNNICTVRVNSNLTLVRNTMVAPGTAGIFIPESVLAPRLQGCQYGGVILQTGVDGVGGPEDQVLQDGEVTSETVECNTVVLIAGLNSLIQTVPATSAQCPTGGIVVRSGVDDNRNNTLEASERDSSRIVCNGYTSLVDPTEFAAGSPLSSNCAGTGGVRVRSGIDGNADGTLQSGEVLDTAYVCDGLSPALEVFEFSASHSLASNCGGTGGVRLRGGYDTNGTSGLQASEIDFTRYVCDGLSSDLIPTTGAWAACDGGTGVRFEAWVDGNGNGIVDFGEITNTSYVCDGLDGLDGIDGLDGLDGFDGADSLIETWHGFQPGCGGDGTRYEVGTDYDGDGFLSGAEINDSWVICDPVL